MKKIKINIKKTETCNICGASYQLFNKSHHKKTKKHIIANEIYELKNKIEQLNNNQQINNAKINNNEQGNKI